VASKDASTVEVDKCSIKHSNLSYAVYTKKAEFGSASMTVNQSKVEDVTKIYLLDLKSQLRLDKKDILGKVKANIDSLYTTIELP